MLVVLIVLQVFNTCYSQFNSCLKQSKCIEDECCFSVVPRTGPVCYTVSNCAQNFAADCCVNQRILHTDFGMFYGYSILLDSSYPFYKEGKSYLGIWQGVPYAQPPTREKNGRFRRPRPLEKSKEKFDATSIREACAQPRIHSSEHRENEWMRHTSEWIHRAVPSRINTTYNEDCLYLNIYAPFDDSKSSISMTSRKRYPILVFFISHDHLTGDASKYPGHVLVQLGMIVVTVNHRLGPFGYLATESALDESSSKEADADAAYNRDDMAMGNYALWDQLQALQFIKEIAPKFQGDPNQITIVGYGSGAADVGMHLYAAVSLPQSQPLFERAVMISGAPDCEGMVHDSKPEEAYTYARQLAHKVGCSVVSKKDMLACLRDRTWQELADASLDIEFHKPDWAKTKPWAVSVDGLFLTSSPEKLYSQNKFLKVPVLGILSSEGSAFEAMAALLRNELMDTSDIVANIGRGKSIEIRNHSKYLNVYEHIAKRDYAMDPPTVAKTIFEEYLYRADSNNHQKQLLNFIHSFTDRSIGSGLVKTLNKISDNNKQNKDPTLARFMVFTYSSKNDLTATTYGSYDTSVLQYIFGLPRLMLNVDEKVMKESFERDLKITVPEFKYDMNVDLNVSDYMLSFISNFVKGGNPTPVPIRNLTWDTYRPENRTYFWLNLTKQYNWSLTHRIDWEKEELGSGFDLRQNYRHIKYAFWDNLYCLLLRRYPRLIIPEPIPDYLESYRYASISIGALCALGLIIILFLIIMLANKRKMT